MTQTGVRPLLPPTSSLRIKANFGRMTEVWKNECIWSSTQVSAIYISTRTEGSPLAMLACSTCSGPYSKLETLSPQLPEFLSSILLWITRLLFWKSDGDLRWVGEVDHLACFGAGNACLNSRAGAVILSIF